MTRLELHTIGYEGSSIGDFLATLETVGIRLLIDVRDVPISRKFDSQNRRSPVGLLLVTSIICTLRGSATPNAVE